MHRVLDLGFDLNYHCLSANHRWHRGTSMLRIYASFSGYCDLCCSSNRLTQLISSRGHTIPNLNQCLRMLGFYRSPFCGARKVSGDMPTILACSCNLVLCGNPLQPECTRNLENVEWNQWWSRISLMKLKKP